MTIAFDINIKSWAKTNKRKVGPSKTTPTETLIQQVTSGRVTARDLQIKNKKYEELQQRITALTAEYNGGTRTLEQFLRAVAYLVPEGENY
ncbi:hypothetical protein T12_11988 [Trichinella patagoniensis]|uniref:Uncharacterized protein n=1 Tax=Trichinella patagoniensis TaxID=990121 RepID=A0A0V0YZV7_9BILA|nr:hypothetical protein T12_11988 [Trichinella patagoniensis]